MRKKTHYKPFEKITKSLYNRSCSKGYRESDNLVVTTEDHAHFRNLLQSLTTSFNQEISVLDIGCGTGRYFHCLSNTKNLVEIDISPFMLEDARNPVLNEEVTVKNIDLCCGNVFDIELPEHSFDFIYSIGVLGEYSPFDLFICNKVYNLLKEKGIFFFTVVDINSKAKTLKRKVAECICPVLPSFARKRLETRLHSFYMTLKELENIMNNSYFSEYKINRHVCGLPKLWSGAHYECIAQKKPYTHKNQVSVNSFP